MRLPSRTTGMIAGVLLLTVAAGLAWQFYQDRVPTIGDVGGTVLVYQLDRHANNNMAGNVDSAVMAEALERRFAYSGLRHVKVRPAGAEQVEVGIPRIGDHAADVHSIKEMVAHVGRLAFRVLANRSDDRDGIEAARRMVNHERGDDARLDKEFADAQGDGLPPPGPRDENGEPGKFVIRLAGGQISTVSYSWVELGEPQRRALRLDNAAKDDRRRRAIWQEAAAHRGEAEQLPDAFAAQPGGFVPPLLQGALFYSRECTNRALTAQERAQKAVDYFVLARDPEFDMSKGQRTPEIDGSYVETAGADRDPFGQLMIGFKLNAAGAELFGTLTRKNVSDYRPGGAVRHLAIILDGQVMSAPTINAEIRGRGTISGSFTERQVADMVTILRAGALPGALLPRPVRETMVEANGGR